MVARFKNILFWSIVGLTLIAAVYSYFALRKIKKPTLDALHVLPDSCLVYLNTNNFFDLSRKISSQSIIADKLAMYDETKPAFTFIEKMDSVFSSTEELKAELLEKTIHFAYYGKKQGFLMCFNINQLGLQSELSGTLTKMLKTRTDESGLYGFDLPPVSGLYLGIDAGVVFIANTKNIILKAQSKKHSKFYTGNSYKHFSNTLQETRLLGVYIDHNLFSVNDEEYDLNLALPCAKALSAGQAELGPSDLKINGYLMPDSSELFSAFVNEESQSPEEILPALPGNLISLTSYAFGSYNALCAKLPKAQRNHMKDYWTKAGEKALYNIAREFGDNIKNQVFTFETSVRGQKFEGAQVGDTALLERQLKTLSDTFYAEAGKKIWKLSPYQSQSPALLYPLINQSAAYACSHGGFLLLAENKEDMLLLLDNLGHDRKATSNESFNYYRSQNFPDTYNVLYYLSPSASPATARSLLRYKTPVGKDPHENMRHFSYSLINDANSFKFRLNLTNEAESNTQERNVLWTLNMDTISDMKASAFVNHHTGENEFVVQDQAFNLYLVNAKGSVLWKKRLEEKMISPVTIVDVYHNGKYQMLFNTKNYLYMLDRNGHEVKGFPVKLPASATAELSLIEYMDSDKKSSGDKQRIFVSCSDNTIYNYNLAGEKQEGFTPVKTEHEVKLPLQYVKVGASDYLVALDKEGKIYTFSRKGEGRIGLKNRSLAEVHAFYVVAGTDIENTFLICVDDKSAMLHKISFTDVRELIKISMEPGAAETRFCLVDDNREMDVMLGRDNRVLAFNLNGELLFEKEMPEEISSVVNYSDESHNFYVCLNNDKTQLVVFDQLRQKVRNINSGTLPLISNLFKDNKKYLIVTSGRQLSCVPVD